MMIMMMRDREQSLTLHVICHFGEKRVQSFQTVDCAAIDIIGPTDDVRRQHRSSVIVTTLSLLLHASGQQYSASIELIRGVIETVRSSVDAHCWSAVSCFYVAEAAAGLLSLDG